MSSPISPLRVFVTNDSLNETRVNIGMPNKGAITNVRAHNALTAFFLRLFGKIEKIEAMDEKTKTQKVYYINKNSLLKRSPNLNQLQGESGGQLVQHIITQVKEKNDQENLKVIRETLKNLSIGATKRLKIEADNNGYSENTLNLIQEVINQKEKNDPTSDSYIKAIDNLLADPDPDFLVLLRDFV